MSKQDLKLIARIAENLPPMDPTTMQGWIDNPKGLKKFLSGLVPDINGLELVTLIALTEIVELPPLHNDFKAKEVFVEGKGMGYGIHIGSMSKEFSQRFLSAKGKILPATEMGSKISWAKFERYTEEFMMMINSFGGVDMVKISLAELYYVLRDKSTRGCLISTIGMHQRNLAVVEDINNQPCIVSFLLKSNNSLHFEAYPFNPTHQNPVYPHSFFVFRSRV